jgi:hypothetical protein
MKFNISKEWLVGRAHLEEWQSIEAGSPSLDFMKTRSVTLTVREITDLAKAIGLIIPDAHEIDAGDDEIEYTIIEKEGGVVVEDDDGTKRAYAHGAYLTEYPEEGTYPLGDELKSAL